MINTDRYQDQPAHIRVYRRLRHQPASIVGFILWLLIWVGCGMPVTRDRFQGSRWNVFTNAWRIRTSMWQVDAKWYYTIEEAFAALDNNHPAPIEGDE